MRIPPSILVHNLCAIETKILFRILTTESNSKFKFQCQVNNGLDCNVKVSIPMEGCFPDTESKR